MSMLSRSVMRGPALWLVHVIAVLQATPALVLAAESNESVCLSLQHRVARDIGEMFADVKTLMVRQSQHTNDLMARLDTIDDRLDTMDGRLDTIDDRLDTIDDRHDTLDGRLNSVESATMARLDTIDDRLNSVESATMARLDTIDDRLNSVESATMARLDTIDDRLDTIDDRLNSVESATMARLDTIGERLDSMDKVSSTLQSHQQDMMSKINLLSLQVSCENRAHQAIGINVPCDSEGWMVIQRRVDNLYDFPTRSWNDYKNGFGDKTKSFWLGLEAMHQLTSGKSRTVLRIELTSFQGESRHAQYFSFRVDGEAEGYRLHVGEYSGTAGDSMTYHDGAKFSTADRDQDTWYRSCALAKQGAWWYKACVNANLNSVYTATGTGPNSKIIFWSKWLGFSRSYKIVTMKVRWE